MARPKCVRRVGNIPDATYFKPRGIPLAELEEVVLTIDELEAIRLADLEGSYHEGAAGKMQVSRATFGRILESAHRKVAYALINGKVIKIEGGVVKMPDRRTFECADCGHTWSVPFGTGRPEACPECGSFEFRRSDRGYGQHRSGAGQSGGNRGRRHGNRRVSSGEAK